jgi:hypothetical protein
MGRTPVGTLGEGGVFIEPFPDNNDFANGFGFFTPKMTPYEITRVQLVGNLLALCVTFVLITVHGRSMDSKLLPDGSLMRSRMEQGYSRDGRTAVMNRRTDATAEIMALHDEMKDPLALSQPDNPGSDLPEGRQQCYIVP